jgi:hypothetical protein
MMTFTENLLVKYKEHTGVIRFISNQYITICVETYEHKVRDVCMLVYPEQWNDIQIVNDYEEPEK